MQEHEKSLYSLLIIGALIAIGNVLTSNDPITPRLFAGRVILGSLVSVVARWPFRGWGRRWGLPVIRRWKCGCADVQRESRTGARQMTLSEKQQLFTVMVASLIHWAEEHGYRLTFGEAYRTPEQAALNAKKGSGISNSLHTQRLAVDFNLFVNGQYKTRTEDYLPLGEYWESLGGAWGGRFKSRPDGNHFSLEHNGVR